MAEFAERLCLDLADTLSCDIKLSSDLLKGTRPSVIHSETETEHLVLSLCQRIEDFVKLLF